jgi:hypothetical protein
MRKIDISKMRRLTYQQFFKGKWWTVYEAYDLSGKLHYVSTHKTA